MFGPPPRGGPCRVRRSRHPARSTEALTVVVHRSSSPLGHANISQTSTYLAGTQRTQHDAMTAYEERLATLQRLATENGKGHRQSPPEAAGAEEMLNETAGGRETAIM